MGASGWGTKHSVEDRLFDEGYRFDFFQAVRLLEMMFADGTSIGEGADPQQEPVRFKSRADLSFPASDVVEIARANGASGDGFGVPGLVRTNGSPAHLPSNDRLNGQTPVTMTVNFMGLAGHLGPLPAPYTELIMDRAWQRDTAFRDFLDIFNHRLISILYRVRKHHHIGLSVASPEKSHVASYLYSLSGLGTGGLKDRMGVEDRALLRYTGLLTQKPRSASGLEAVLSDYFRVPVRVQQYVGCWHTLEDHQTTYIASPEARPGQKPGRVQNNILGRNVVLGSRVWRQDGRFDLHLGPLTLPEYLDMLPTGDAHRPLNELTRFYINRDLDFKYVLKVKPEEMPVMKLGSLMGPRLGWTSWLMPSPRRAPRTPDAPAAERASAFEITITPNVLPPELQKVRLPFFADLSPSMLRILIDYLRPALVYREGMVIAREGEAGVDLESLVGRRHALEDDEGSEGAAFVIDSGSVYVLRAEHGNNDVVLDTLTEGDFFGEATLRETGTRYLNTYVAAEDSEILILTRRMFDRLMEKYPPLARAVEVYRREQGISTGGPIQSPLMRKLKALRADLFAGLSDVGLSEVAKQMTLIGLPPGQRILERGKPGRALYVISKGTVRVDLPLADGDIEEIPLGPGDFFGEMEMLFGENNFASVTTTSAVELMELTRAGVERIIARYPPIEDALRVAYHYRFTEITRSRHGR